MSRNRNAEANLENSREKEIYRGEGAAAPRLGTPRAQLGLRSRWQAGWPPETKQDRGSTRRESFNRDRTDGRVGPGPAGGSCLLPGHEPQGGARGGGFKNTAALTSLSGSRGLGSAAHWTVPPGRAGSPALPAGRPSRSCPHTGSWERGALGQVASLPALPQLAGSLRRAHHGAPRQPHPGLGLKLCQGLVGLEEFRPLLAGEPCGFKSRGRWAQGLSGPQARRRGQPRCTPAL